MSLKVFLPDASAPLPVSTGLPSPSTCPPQWLHAAESQLVSRFLQLLVLGFKLAQLVFGKLQLRIAESQTSREILASLWPEGLVNCLIVSSENARGCRRFTVLLVEAAGEVGVGFTFESPEEENRNTEICSSPLDSEKLVRVSLSCPYGVTQPQPAEATCERS